MTDTAPGTPLSPGAADGGVINVNADEAKLHLRLLRSKYGNGIHKKSPGGSNRDGSVPPSRSPSPGPLSATNPSPEVSPSFERSKSSPYTSGAAIDNIKSSFAPAHSEPTPAVSSTAPPSRVGSTKETSNVREGSRPITQTNARERSTPTTQSAIREGSRPTTQTNVRERSTPKTQSAIRETSTPGTQSNVKERSVYSSHMSTRETVSKAQGATTTRAQRQKSTPPVRASRGQGSTRLAIGGAIGGQTLSDSAPANRASTYSSPADTGGGTGVTAPSKGRDGYYVPGLVGRSRIKAEQDQVGAAQRNQSTSKATSMRGGSSRVPSPRTATMATTASTRSVSQASLPGVSPKAVTKVVSAYASDVYGSLNRLSSPRRVKEKHPSAVRTPSTPRKPSTSSKRDSVATTRRTAPKASPNNEVVQIRTNRTTTGPTARATVKSNLQRRPTTLTAKTQMTDYTDGPSMQTILVEDALSPAHTEPRQFPSIAEPLSRTSHNVPSTRASFAGSIQPKKISEGVVGLKPGPRQSEEPEHHKNLELPRESHLDKPNSTVLPDEVLETVVTLPQEETVLSVLEPEPSLEPPVPVPNGLVYKNGFFEVQINDDRVECPHCTRKFAPKAAERHIPKCSNTKKARPKPPKLVAHQSFTDHMGRRHLREVATPQVKVEEEINRDERLETQWENVRRLMKDDAVPQYSDEDALNTMEIRCQHLIEYFPLLENNALQNNMDKGTLHRSYVAKESEDPLSIPARDIQTLIKFKAHDSYDIELAEQGILLILAFILNIREVAKDSSVAIILQTLEEQLTV